MLDGIVWHLFDRAPVDSASYLLTNRQFVTVFAVLILFLVGFVIVPTLASLMLGFSGVALFVMRAILHLSCALSPQKGAHTCILPTDAQLPCYTILVPLFREYTVVEDLFSNLEALNYPDEKLDIKIICEEDDFETLDAVKACLKGGAQLEPFELIIVPKGLPQTKPRALCFAMQFAKGDFVVVYDAEDRPHRDQLRLAVGVFAESSELLGCLQAALIVDHAGESLFSRLFAIEYAALFGLILPTLSRLGIAFPLGGTSNHFRFEALEDVGGWDPFNVTEDADIGIRLVRAGWSIEVLPSVTYEEAPLTLRAWMNQRIRWMKGWLQTTIVHSRQPLRTFRELGFLNFVVLAILLPGSLIAILTHPIVIAIAVGASMGFLPLGTFFRVPDGPALYSLIVLISLGYGSVILLCGRALLQRNINVGLGWIFFMPLYWVLLAVAVLVALVELVVRPFHWRKTDHGLAEQRSVHGTTSW